MNQILLLELVEFALEFELVFATNYMVWLLAPSATVPLTLFEKGSANT